MRARWNGARGERRGVMDGEHTIAAERESRAAPLTFGVVYCLARYCSTRCSRD